MKNRYIIIFTIFLYYKIYSDEKSNLKDLIKIFNIKKNNNNDEDNKKIKNIKNNNNKHIQQLKRNFFNIGYKFQNKMNITEVESCKQMNEMFKNPEAVKNIKKIFTFFDNDGRKDLLDFLLNHSHFIKFLEDSKDVDNIKKIFKSLQDLKQDIKNEELVNLYDAMLATPELVDLFKNIDPDSLAKLDETVNLYSKVDKKDKEPIEYLFKYLYMHFIYYTCMPAYGKFFRENKDEIKDIINKVIEPAFIKYVQDFGLLVYVIKNNPENKKSIELLKNDIESNVKSFQDTFKKQMDEYGKGVEEGVKRKLNAYRTSGKPTKKIPR